MNSINLFRNTISRGRWKSPISCLGTPDFHPKIIHPPTKNVGGAALMASGRDHENDLLMTLFSLPLFALLFTDPSRRMEGQCNVLSPFSNAVWCNRSVRLRNHIKLNHNQTGFDILRSLDKIDFEIIVTTAYEKYPNYACRVSVVDFLVKPVSKDELIEAVAKYKKKWITCSN